MDFNKFQEWCQNRGFVVKLPSGYSKLINLDVSSFESFKGIFNLCMIFFYEELYKQREKETSTEVNEKEILAKANKINRNGNFFVINPDTAIKFENGSSTPLSNPDGTVRSNYNQISYMSSKKYFDEAIQKVFNYLVTPNDDGTVPMDKLLKYLDDKEEALLNNDSVDVKDYLKWKEKHKF